MANSVVGISSPGVRVRGNGARVHGRAWSERVHRRTTEQLPEEERLVTKCLEGDRQAWEMMFNRYQPHLLSIIRSLAPGMLTQEQAEEIASRVWCSLCYETYARLRHYDPRIGHLLNYLVGMARSEILNWRRTEKNRQVRECQAARSEATCEETDRRILIQEFLSTLTRAEREFCLHDLMRIPGREREVDLSASNGYQLRSRVLKKFRTFCGHRTA